MATSIARRAFLLGRSDRSRTPHSVARVGAGCLESQGIVCRRCGEACADRAVRFLPLPAGLVRPVIDPMRCTGCADCVAACPAEAIAMEGARA